MQGVCVWVCVKRDSCVGVGVLSAMAVRERMYHSLRLRIRFEVTKFEDLLIILLLLGIFSSEAL